MFGLLASERHLRTQGTDQAVEAGLERGRALDHRQLVMTLVGGVEVDRDDQVAMARHHRHDRQRVEDAAIDQHAIALHHRRKQAGNGRRGTHGLVQAAFLEPDFLLVGQVGGHRRIGDAQVFDVDFANDLADLPEDLFPADRPQAKTDVHQAQHVEVIQALDPVAIIIEFAGGVDPADHRTHGTTGDTGDIVATPFDFLDNADMGIAPGSTRAQHQCDTLFH
ncbi:hypothetical protein D3C76_816410 [compost metagenome]